MVGLVGRGVRRRGAGVWHAFGGGLGRMTDLYDLTERLRALRLPDEEMVLVAVGHMRDCGCGERGAVRVIASKSDITETVDALRLEDALLMVRHRIDARIKARNEAAADARAKSKVPA